VGTKAGVWVQGKNTDQFYELHSEPEQHYMQQMVELNGNRAAVFAYFAKFVKVSVRAPGPANTRACSACDAQPELCHGNADSFELYYAAVMKYGLRKATESLIQAAHNRAPDLIHA